MQFWKESFFPDEPVLRGTKLMVGNGFIDRQIANIIEEFMVKEGLKDKTSMIALDKNGDIIGCRLEMLSQCLNTVSAPIERHSRLQRQLK